MPGTTETKTVLPQYDAHTLSVEMDRFQAFALAAAPHAAAVANYCDHAEHNEPLHIHWVTEAGAALADLAVDLASASGAEIVGLYAERLGTIEERNVLARPDGFSGRAAALAAATWRDLQLVQTAHDRHYHPDVIGMARLDQLRHYAFHLAKIVGAFAAPEDPGDLVACRLPDTLLFAIKLRTVMGQRLPDEALPGRQRGDAAGV
jgi:hypothetical protein